MGRHFKPQDSKRKEQRQVEKTRLQDIRKGDSRNFEEKAERRVRVHFVNRGLGKMVSAQNFWVSINSMMKCEEILQRIEFAFNLDLQEVNRR